MAVEVKFSYKTNLCRFTYRVLEFKKAESLFWDTQISLIKKLKIKNLESQLERWFGFNLDPATASHQRTWGV
jgi:hypothetical protein